MNDFNPALLVQARGARSMSQTELAKMCGCRQAYVSKVENRQLQPSDDFVGQAADALELPTSFFFQHPPFRRLPNTFYRKRKTASAMRTRSIDAKVSLMRMRIDVLLRSVDLPAVRVPRIDLEDHGLDADVVAGELRIRWNLPPGPIENLTATLEDNGVLVIPFQFNDPKIDGLSVWALEDDLPPLIFVNPDVPGDRLRFTLAHELAHAVLHHHLLALPPDFDKQADQFAAGLLMPADDIRPYLRRVSLQSLVQLKPTWRVSMQSLLHRSGSLGTTSERQRKYVWMQISKLGYRKNEPVEIPQEPITLFRDVLTTHMSELGYTREQLADALHMLPAELDTMIPRNKHALRAV